MSDEDTPAAAATSSLLVVPYECSVSADTARGARALDGGIVTEDSRRFMLTCTATAFIY